MTALLIIAIFLLARALWRKYLQLGLLRGEIDKRDAELLTARAEAKELRGTLRRKCRAIDEHVAASDALWRELEAVERRNVWLEVAQWRRSGRKAVRVCRKARVRG